MARNAVPETPRPPIDHASAACRRRASGRPRRRAARVAARPAASRASARSCAGDREHRRVDAIVEHVLALGRGRRGRVTWFSRMKRPRRGAAGQRERRAPALPSTRAMLQAEAREVAGRRPHGAGSDAVVMPVHLHRHRPASRERGRRRRDGAGSMPPEMPLMTSRSMRKWSISVCVVIAALIMLTPLRTMTTRLPRSVPVVKRLPLIVQVRAPRVSLDEDRRLLAERRDDADARRALAEAGARRGGARGSGRAAATGARARAGWRSSILPWLRARQAKFMPAARRAPPARPAAAPSRCARAPARSRSSRRACSAATIAGSPLAAQRVAERDREVALPALEADAADRAALGLAQEVVLVPGPERRAARGASSAGADVEVGDRARARELVPRADELAVVAAVDAVADRGAELDRDRALRARSSGTRCSGARRARRARRSPASGRRRCRRCSCRSGRRRPALSGRATSTKISPRKNIEPASRSSASVCLPRQPMPLRAASSTSSTGAESVKTRWPNGPIASASGRRAGAGAGAAPCDSRGRGRRSRPPPPPGRRGGATRSPASRARSSRGR